MADDGGSDGDADEGPDADDGVDVRPDAEGHDDAGADPFDALADEVADRDGDPFERLGAPDAGGGDPQTGSEPGSGAGSDDPSGGDSGRTAPGTDPFADLPGGDRGRSPDADEQAEGGSAGDAADAGVSDAGAGRTDDSAVVGSGADAGAERRGDPFESAESAFQEMDVADLDPDQVWETLDEAESRGSVSQSRERTYAEVSKHAYCEGCEWFSGPPAVSCGHEGTEILEFVDMETVRVVDCPIVAERRDLEERE